MNARVSIVKCDEYVKAGVDAAVRQVINRIGGITAFVKPGETILIKPNLLSAHVPEDAVTTHPEIVRAVVRLLKENNVVPVIGDSPSVFDTAKVNRATGMDKIAREENVELVNFSNLPVKQYIPKLKLTEIKQIHLSDIINRVDGIINLPKLKTHSLTTVTFGIKNLYGLIPGSTKAMYHKLAYSTEMFTNLLVELYAIVQPKIRLTLMDGIVGMDKEGPSNGRIRQIGILACSNDTVALDTVISSVVNINLKEMKLLRLCSTFGLGEISLSKIEITGDKPNITDFVLPKTHIVNYIPGSLLKILSNFVWWRPVILKNKCRICNKCVEICPQNTIFIKKKHLKINHKNCISCFCCNEVCPYNAIYIKTSLLLSLGRKIKRLAGM